MHAVRSSRIHVESNRLIACSYHRRGQDKTVLSCLVRVGGVNKLLDIIAYSLDKYNYNYKYQHHKYKYQYRMSKYR